MGAAKTISATEFKATCLQVLDRVQSGELSRVEVTKRGRVVAVLSPPPATMDLAKGLHGALRGRVAIPEGFDLTAPTLDEPSAAKACALNGCVRSRWAPAGGAHDAIKNKILTTIKTQ